MKKISLKKVIIIIFVIELALVLISGGLTKKLQIGFSDGQFVFRHIARKPDIKEDITEEFQTDVYLNKAAKLSSEEIINFTKFTDTLIKSDNRFLKKIINRLPVSTSEMLYETVAWEEMDKKMLIEDINAVLKQEDFLEKEFLTLIDLDNPETKYLRKQFHQQKLSKNEQIRLARLLMQSVITEDILKHQEVKPEIYGSFRLYNFFKQVFGEKSALSAFQLLRMLLIVDIIIIIIALLTNKMLFKHPSKPQVLFEGIYNMFEEFVIETLGKKNSHFTPYIVTLFLFIWLCNVIGTIPIPGFMEPTRNLNVTLGLGVLAVIIVHITAIKSKGFFKHIQNFINPVKNPLFLLDIVGEFSKVISISFRLFGNILGGAIIILVVSGLVKFIMLPVGLNMFFGIFVGSIQAFVFTMLALTYIGVEIVE